MRGRRAFTLVEMIVVLTIMLLLTGSAAALLRAVAGAREVTDSRLGGEQEAMVALRTITNALRNVYRPVTAQDDLLFVGVSDDSGALPSGHVRFRAIDRRVIRRGQPESDVHELEFFVRTDDAGHTQLMRRSDPTHNPDPDGGGVLEPIANDVVALDLQYFDAGVWQDTWPEKMKRLPTAVSVRLIYRADEDRDPRNPRPPKLAAVSRIVNFPYLHAAQTGGDTGTGTGTRGTNGAGAGTPAGGEE